MKRGTPRAPAACRGSGAARVPGLVIAGAPKCGTSSLFQWLSAHPAVQGSTVKETGFLLDRGHPMFNASCNVHDHGVQAYARFFDGAEARPGSLLLEATPHYLYQETAPAELARLEPVPDVVFLLRKPGERVHSSFRYTQNNLGLLRPEATFSDFLALCSGADPRRVTNPEWGGKVDIWRNDVAYSRYAHYLSRWAQRFPRERMHVFLYEDMRRDPRAFMHRVAAAVGIDDAFYREYPFPAHNRSYQVKSLRLQRLARRFGALVPRGPARAFLRDGYMRAFTRTAAAPGARDGAALRDLEASFAADNARLAREWGLDLSPWEDV